MSAITYSQLKRHRGDIREQVAEFVVKNGWGLLELRREEMTLEDIFVNLVTRE